MRQFQLIANRHLELVCRKCWRNINKTSSLSDRFNSLPIDKWDLMPFNFIFSWLMHFRTRSLWHLWFIASFQLGHLRRSTMCVFSSSLGHNHSRLLNFVSGLMEQDWVMGNNGLLSWTLRVIHYALKYPNKQQRYYVVIDFKFPRLSTCYNNDLILSTSEIQTLILCRQGRARGEICHCR